MTVDVTSAIIDVEYDGSERCVKQLSAMTGLPGWAIRRSREPAGPKQGRRHYWAAWQEEVVKAHLGMLTDEEVEELRRNVPNPRALDNLTNLSLAEIGALVGHSATAVKIRITRKGWTSWTKNPRWMTATAVAKAMGVDSHSVTKWIERGYLNADAIPFRDRLVHRVVQNDLDDFITDPENWAYYDPHKIADPVLREKALAVRDGREYLSTADVAAQLGCGVNWIAELIRRDKIPAKRWGNYWIHRDDAERIRLPGVGRGDSNQFRSYPVEEDVQIVRGRSVGMPYVMIAIEIGRIPSSACERWKRIRNDGLADLAGQCGPGTLLADGQVLASWKAMARAGETYAARILERAVDRFLLGSTMTSREMVALQGLFEAWMDFFVDHRQLRRERVQAKYKVIRDQGRLRALYLKLLSIGLDPCHDRWAAGWDAVPGEGRRLTVEEARNGSSRPVLRDPPMWRGTR